PMRRGPNPDIMIQAGHLRFGRATLYPLGEVSIEAIDGESLDVEPLGDRCQLELGHCYLLVQPFRRYAIFRVDAVAPGGTHTLDWYSENYCGQAAGSHRSTGENDPGLLMDQLKRAARKRLELKQPFAHLQLQVQSQGGNPCVVSMAGKSRYLQLAADPLAVVGVPQSRGEEAAYCEGGLVPEGMVFVVERVEYRVLGSNVETKRKRPVGIRVGNTHIVKESNLTEDLHSVWTGQVELRPGNENSVSIEGTYNVAMDVKISGQFIPDPGVRAR
ncbi:MAG: hypothetical protein P1V35_16590, partial [Planctomycetota bacterium]|nr:hypothetical protein [Planctomycetota bacterium]